MQPTRRMFLASMSAAGLAAQPWGPGARAAAGETVLRIAMTAADVPLLVGAPDNGFEGYRFAGYTIFDALVNWDLSKSDKAATITPGLATSWENDPQDKTKWIFHLRKSVRFYDGSTFDADAVLWNFDKLKNNKAPQFDARQDALIGFRIPSAKSWRKIDDDTVEVTTKAPDGFFPYQMTYLLIASPAQWEKLGRDWGKVAFQPSGTGPWQVERLVPHERAELVRNPEYWNKDRVPKTDRLVLLPIPEANTRTAALLSGQADWIEAPTPDAVPRLKSAGMQIVSNGYPHVWPWQFSMLPDSPWKDVRVRKAANLAVDRDGLVSLLGGLALPAKGFVLPGSPWFGKPSFEVKYDPDAAKKLMKEAGHGPDNPLKAKVLISASGSGQMQPLAMNEYIQQNLAEIGIKVEFDTMEWQTLLDRLRVGAKAPENKGASAINVSFASPDPFSAFVRFIHSDSAAPVGYNWGYYSDKEMDEDLDKASGSFIVEEQNKWLQKVHEKEVDEALWLFVVHDVAPRALTPKVKGFVQAQSWFQDLTPVTVAP